MLFVFVSLSFPALPFKHALALGRSIPLCLGDNKPVPCPLRCTTEHRTLRKMERLLNCTEILDSASQNYVHTNSQHHAVQCASTFCSMKMTSPLFGLHCCVAFVDPSVDGCFGGKKPGRCPLATGHFAPGLWSGWSPLNTMHCTIC